MSERARAVFRQLVEAYLSSGGPVGSRTLSQSLPISLSPASVRNVLADLEKMGLLYSPHTSAGRVPTDIGLRLFVDGMLQVGDLSREERGTIEDVLEPYLIQQGFMMRTARGRVATGNAYLHFGLAPPSRGELPDLALLDQL